MTIIRKNLRDGPLNRQLQSLLCIVLYCIVLYCIAFYCIVLHCVVLYCTVGESFYPQSTFLITCRTQKIMSYTRCFAKKMQYSIDLQGKLFKFYNFMEHGVYVCTNKLPTIVAQKRIWENDTYRAHLGMWLSETGP